VLLDSTKLGKKVGMLFKEFDKIDLLITGKEADPTIIQELRNRGLDIILA
ncbi:TPA: HTH-type transcriptional regulator UlaR, partial [Mannheimia haemolytica]|nr:HTH-type transcriptional regulator UlaR [Mannheimia haemolytica]